MNTPKKNRSINRQLKAELRDTLLLLREFRNPLLFFFLAMVGNGWLYFTLANTVGEPVNSLNEAIYLVLTLTFLQPNGNFPHAWYLQIFYFLMPLLGIGILAQGLANFGVLLFNRRARGKEWEMALASTLNDHIVLVGLGHLGYRVVKFLHEMGRDVVVVDNDPKADLIETVRKMGIPVIQDDAARETILESTKVNKAHSIILCIQNDSLNLQIAVKARAINPKINVIIRIFDEDFAESLEKQFGFHALSATGMAAPVFAASAADIEITPPITFDDQPHSLARINIDPGSKIDGLTVQKIEETYDINVVLVSHDHQKDIHPHSNLKINAGDVIAVFGSPEQISLLAHQNH